MRLRTTMMMMMLMLTPLTMTMKEMMCCVMRAAICVL